MEYLSVLAAVGLTTAGIPAWYTATPLELVRFLWLLALVPFKVRNLLDAYADWSFVRRIPPTEQDAGTRVVARGTWWIDVSVGLILLSYLAIATISLFIPPSVFRVVNSGTITQQLFGLLSAVGLTSVIWVQYRMRVQWRRVEPSLPDGETITKPDATV